MPIVLVVHGGAWNIPDEALTATRDGVRRALEEGWTVLGSGGSALDAVERVIRILEDDPNFDAGRGSRLNSEGKVEMDASVMDGDRGETARRFHDATKHSYQSLHQVPHFLDWDNQPLPFKLYRALRAISLPDVSDAGEVSALDAMNMQTGARISCCC